MQYSNKNALKTNETRQVVKVANERLYKLHMPNGESIFLQFAKGEQDWLRIVVCNKKGQIGSPKQATRLELDTRHAHFALGPKTVTGLDGAKMVA